MSTKIVLYYANWCGHCHAFMPVWEELGKTINEKGLNISTESIEDGKMNEQQKGMIDGFPTIHIIKGDNILKYSGKRDVDSILKFCYQDGESGNIQKGGKNKMDDEYKIKYLKYSLLSLQ